MVSIAERITLAVTTSTVPESISVIRTLPVHGLS
jgi:hypothetical protein